MLGKFDGNKGFLYEIYAIIKAKRIFPKNKRVKGVK